MAVRRRGASSAEATA
uniref:K-exchanger-like protein n=1 Tax=Arundo donax TaxID=35708 RepID=A0A0A9D1I0_ARUDO